MYTWIFATGVIFAFYNAWGGGANDCANSFATAVGSKTLTLKQAVLVASVFEFTGAVLMGSHVTDSVRKNIVSLDIFEDDPGALMLGMLCADLASAIWLTVATYLRWPVSTTHSIIGAIIGFALAYGGDSAVNWEKTGYIVLSWLVSPLLAGIFSLTFFTFIKKFVFDSLNPFERTEKIFPVLTFVTFFINTLFIIYKGSPALDIDEMPIEKCIGISIGIGVFTASISQFIYLPYARKRTLASTDSGPGEIEMQEVDSSRSSSYINTFSDLEGETQNHHEVDEEDNLDTRIEKVRQNLTTLITERSENKINELHKNAYHIDEKSDKLCSWLQIFTSCFSSFAHGSNDVANAVAPLATIYSIYTLDRVESTAVVPVWILLIGGVGIVFGLATWGYKIIDKIGRELTKVSPSRGFIIELAAAITVIIASRTELPVSTTHCQVGSVVGCGLSNGKKNVQWKLLKGIVWSWVITLPVTGFLSAALFSYGFYSPNSLSNITMV